MPTLINTGRSGVVYDMAGHSLGGGERLAVPKIDHTAQDAIDRGLLRVEDDTADPKSPGKAADATSGASRAE